VSQPDTLHLDADHVAAMIDGTLDDEERARVVAHLADCALCRQEIADVRATQRSSPSSVRLRWVGSAAAAVLAGIFLIGPLLSREPAGPVLRAAPAGSDVIEITAPSPTPDPDRELVFTWRAVEPGAIYTLILMDESADVIWRVDGVRDTTARLPSDHPLQRGTTYLYAIDALLPDGRTITSGTRRLNTQR